MKKATFCFVLLFATLCFLQPGHAGSSPFLSSNGNGALLAMFSDTAREGVPLVRRAEGFNTTRGEILKSVFDLLGWGHELRVLQRICPGDPVACLSSGIRPSPPEPFFRSPQERITLEDVRLLQEWVSKCRASLIWDFSVAGQPLQLKLHKEGIALGSEAWEVRLEERLEESDGLRKMEELSEAGWPAALRKTPDGFFDLIVGPYPSFLEASRAFAALPRIAGMHMAPPPFLPAPPPLFWAALVSENGFLPEVRLASEIGKSRATLSELAQAFEAEGGINGGFFSGPVPIGTLVINGIPFHQSFGDRSAVGLAPDRAPVFGNGAVELEMETEKGSFRLDRLNEFPLDGEISLVFERSPFPGPERAKSEGEKEVPVYVKVGTSVSIPPIPGRLIGSGEPSRLSDLKHGSRVSLRTLWRDPRFLENSLVIQAGPAIVRNCQVNGASEDFNDSTRLERHPRSMVGWDGDSLWWIVVDGRDPSHSMGLTLEEAGGLAISLGLKEVLNLDGGGSSSLWWKDGLVSSPSGGSERPIPYAILFKAASSDVFK